MPARYTWDGTGYVDQKGRRPDIVKIKRALDVTARSPIASVRKATADLRAGRIPLEKWQKIVRGAPAAPATASKSQSAARDAARSPIIRNTSREAVRLALDKALDKANGRAQSLAKQLQGGKIDLSTWRTGMRDVVKQTHLYSAMAAKGGRSQMTKADYGRVGQILARGPKGGRGQYQYLERFAREIQAGLPLDGRFLQRVRLYTQSPRSTYHIFDQRVHASKGFEEERNVRFAGDSCDGCVAADRSGWVEIGTLVPIGQRDCVGNCRCRIDFR